MLAPSGLQDVCICGAGPAGLAAAHAILAARPNLRVAVLERSDLRPRGATVLLPPNGVHALEAIQPALKPALARHHLDHRSTRRYDRSGQLVQATEEGQLTAALCEHGDIISLPWHRLQRELADALPPGAQLHTHHRFLRYTEQPGSGTVVAEFETPQGVRSVEAKLLLGCDGGQSLVREQLLGDGPPAYLGRAIWRAVRPRPADWVVDHGWVSWGSPGQAAILTATLLDGTIAWQTFAPWPADKLHLIGGGRRAYVQEEGTAGADGQADQGSEHQGHEQQPAEVVRAQRLARVQAAIDGYPQIVRDLIAGTDPAAITEHGQFARDPEQCQVYSHGRVALVGDAAHLSTPFLGQGCSQAIEDALELGRAVGLHGATPDALAAYQRVRVPLASAVQAVSVQMFKDLAGGKGVRNEFDVSIEQGFVQRKFEPLRPAAAAAVGAVSG